MNKRKCTVGDSSVQMYSNPKQIKLSNSCAELLNDIDFVDFDDEFTSSEGTNDEQLTTASTNFVTNLLDGIDFDSCDASDQRDKLLDLSIWKRCIIDECRRDGHDLVVAGYEDAGKCDKQKTDCGKRMICRLQHYWTQCRIEAGDIVSIVAVWNTKIKSYCVTNTNGFVVVRPDFLVSGTTVVSGLFCMRKAVLQDRFKGIEAGMKIMTVGSIVHELFQIVLRRRLTTREQIKAVSDEMLSDDGMAYTLYASSMKSAEARTEFDGFLERIYEFMQQYVEGKAPTTSNKTELKFQIENFDGTIESIQDIEENIWVPRLGLKGKVDVSVNVKCRPRNGASKKKSLYMPLELKTGRASFSAEHSGQLIIYQMMMSEIEQSTVESGLLLYLREGVMREVKGTHNERRDLILLRNEISYYLAKQFEAYANIGQKSLFDEENGTSNDDLLTELMRVSYIPELPEPINRGNVCPTCPYNILCSVYLNQDSKTLSSLDAKHPMRELAPLVTAHLNDAHINYFCHWIGLMVLEDQENKKLNPNKVLWLETPEHRQKCGRAVCDLILNPDVQSDKEGEYIHEFSTKIVDLTSFGFSLGNYLIVSTPKRYSVAAGPVIAITENVITLILDRNLCDRYRNEKFIIDKYESQTNATFNMSNLGALLDTTEAAERLRKIVIDRVQPTFTKTLPKVITTKGKSILMTLNANQRSAVLKALTANEYLLLKGLPGTGKTQTLAALIRLLVLMEKSVLITSHTHSAVDNVLMRLRKCDNQIKFMRLGSAKRIHSELRECSEEFYTSNCKTPDELAEVYNQFSVVGVTCLGSGHPLLTQRVFDVCLVDESTQVFQSTVLRPLFSAKKIILVGDPDQLPPIVRSQIGRKLGADESLFARLDSPQATVALTHQYRMNKTITKLANDLTYHGELKCANDNVSNATFKTKVCTKIKWIQRTLSPHIDQSVIFLNTGSVAEINSETVDRILGCASTNGMRSPTKIKSTRIYTNYCEVAVILAIVNELKAMGLASNMIGIIAPYALQVELLRKSVAQHFDNDIEVNTVDQYQGRDKEVIIYSCTRSKGKSDRAMKSVEMRRNNEILEDQRRLTVAITRAKHKLIMIGDTASLDNYRPFRMLITSMSKMNKINLVDQQQGFDWRTLLSIFNAN
ncbi:DNA replication ATP-dependent helicase/nuclease DNA2 isoform X1 [Sitodiplosis mosellana]|uniref:DNA replication ATP-dependent helicase/nuclease DNA2 isoform X1 n=1 Tax=Sitodiplosis mosellana TaxID=263140 RepID=UPI002444357B|nr:DNA replication ATP-dependent helicase/nuclease DNA2 isoform X1 [Sitodiplosis mosellana]